MWKLPFPANPVAGISPFPVPDQALQDISRSTIQVTRPSGQARLIQIKIQLVPLAMPKHGSGSKVVVSDCAC
jgi:hypothetical protein